MPDGKTHSIATLAAAGVLAVAAPAFAHQVGLDAIDALGACLGAAAGLVINPDLDLAEAGGTISHKLVRRHLGCGPALAWGLLWYPYGFIAEHRGLSHAPVLGTLLRIAYVLGVLALLLAGLLYLAGVGEIWPAASLREFASWVVYLSGFHALRWALLGLIVSDLVHIGLDGIAG